MIIAVKILAILFAALHLAAAASQLRSKTADGNSALMSAGTVMMAASVAMTALNWLSALVGGAVVCLAAYRNGRRNGKVNPLHHIIRAAVVAVITLGYIIW